MSNLGTFNKIIKSVWSIENLDEIEDSFGPDEIEAWDSLSHIELVVALEEEFEISMAVQDISRLYTIGDIKNTLRRYGVEI
ncbi:acyl carrier protein [Clostridium beijerinckii]|uniref:Acyl carrier protein n=1 Tax=Clostridium beijerinckii TaxID=1520 RepID=A0A7Y8ZKK4_CLOBE|nr:acyl carrier protein [Clostridium beijerinckii]AQS04835.1 acyl carrier protein [Clostridium beijerinckii]MBA2888414.1 acyl carrier protein [Clostridium beijerinckii]MBA2903184.1 acyl carrier protein [Clostridium beijerinckii]MBA2913010.1 acyl carrier protein [Clostridium beijerinckii]MBA9015604.1 acyl carrier protein [Clostridium beijerinckii]